MLQNYFDLTIYEKHDGCLIRSRNCLPFLGTWVHPPFLGGVHGPCCSFFGFCVVLLHVFTFWVPCCRNQRCSVPLYHWLFEGGLMSYSCCISLRIVICHTYRVVILFCFSLYHWLIDWLVFKANASNISAISLREQVSLANQLHVNHITFVLKGYCLGFFWKFLTVHKWFV